MLEALQYQFMQNALLAGLLAAIACGIVGVYVVVKRVVFISGGIAHASFGGIGLGYLLSWGVTSLLGFPCEVSVWMTLIAVVFSVSIGLLFGIYPADRAARMDPIEALGRE